MSRFLEVFFGTIPLSITIVYIQALFYNKKRSYTTKNFWIYVIVYNLFVSIVYILTQNFAKIIVNYFIMVFCNKFCFKENLVKSLVNSLITMLLLTLSEVICVSVVVRLSGLDLDSIKNQLFATLFSNTFVSSCLFVMVSIDLLTKNIQKHLVSKNFKSLRPVLVISFISIVCLSILLYALFFQIDFLQLLILIGFTISMIVFLILYVFNEQNENAKLKAKYELSNNDLKKYEKMLHEYRMENHENKHQLYWIRGLVEDNPKAVSYIDSLLKTKKVSKKELLMKTTAIPFGGLQALIHQKLAETERTELHYLIEVDRDIDSDLLDRISMDLNQKICALTGIYLGNAVDSALETEDKLLGIRMYLEKGFFHISISNSYQGMIDFDKMDEIGYTTKDDSHGYGLSEAKRILAEEKKLKISKIISGNIFTNIIRIKIKM